MRKRIKLEQLGDEIAKIYKNYDKDLRQQEIHVLRKVCSAGAGAMRDSASVVINKRYGRGWGYKTEQDRFRMTGWIYHQQTPGLPHLLEHGHAMPQGGRSKAKVHIYPVAEKLEQDFVDETIRGLGEAGVNL